jgi:hypothetical protein
MKLKENILKTLNVRGSEKMESITLVDKDGFTYDVMEDGTSTPKDYNIIEDIKRKSLCKKDADTLLAAYAAFTLPPQEDK